MGQCDFNESDCRWKCCCGCMHVKDGAIVLAILGIIFGILSVYGIILVVPLAAMLLYGAKQERSGFMLPYLIFLILELFLSVAIIILAIVSLVTGTTMLSFGANYLKKMEEHERAEHPEMQETTDPTLNINLAPMLSTICIVIIATGSISIILHAYFTLVIYRAYVYVRDKKNAMMAGAYPGFGQMNPAAYGGNGYQQPIYIPQGQVNQGYA